MNLSMIANRVANKTGGKPPIQTGPKLPVQVFNTEVTAETLDPMVTVTTADRPISECKSETTIRLNNLSQAEFIKSHEAMGESDLVDFVDLVDMMEVMDTMES